MPAKLKLTTKPATRLAAAPGLSPDVFLLGQDFDCAGIPVGTEEADLVKCLTRRVPAPKCKPKKFSVSRIHSWADHRARFPYFAFTQGYGEVSDYMLFWRSRSGAFNLADMAELRDYCAARCRQLMSAYQFSTTALPPPRSGSCLALKQNDFYPLIEPSEKGVISYNLGSTLAGPVAHRFFVERGDGELRRLFHQRLIKSAVNCQFTANIQSVSEAIPDYVACVTRNSRMTLHLIESKGSGNRGVNTAAIVKGLKQLTNILTIDGTVPASRNVLHSHMVSTSPSQTRVVTNMLRLVDSHERGAVDRYVRKPSVMNVLNGLYMLGLAALWTTIAASELEGDYVRIKIPDYPLIAAIHVGAHAQLKRLLAEFTRPSQRPYASVHEDDVRMLPPRLHGPDAESIAKYGKKFFAHDASPHNSPAERAGESWLAVEGRWLWVCVLASPAREDGGRI
jgi:hypothetical protein